MQARVCTKPTALATDDCMPSAVISGKSVCAPLIGLLLRERAGGAARPRQRAALVPSCGKRGRLPRPSAPDEPSGTDLVRDH
jgi:hypothetical protein